MITTPRIRGLDIKNLNTVKVWLPGNLLRDLRDRDVAQKPTWMYLRRSRKRIPGSHAVEGNAYNVVSCEAGTSDHPAFAGMTFTI